MSEELKPCPFCGRESISIDEGFKNPKGDCEWYIECLDCPTVIWNPKKDALIAAWNRRPSPPPSSEMREAMDAGYGEGVIAAESMAVKRIGELEDQVTRLGKELIVEQGRTRRAHEVVSALYTPSAEIAGAELEAVAAECHRQWSGWWEYMALKMTVDSGRHLGLHYVDMWQRKANTDYADLTEAEKESDRVEARKILSRLAELRKEK